MKTNKRFKYLSLFLVLVMSFSLLVACGSDDGEEIVEENEETEEVAEETEEVEWPLTIVDDSGEEVEFEEPAEKIVSLAPSHTETLFAIGLEDEIVGVTSYCDYPEEANEKEEVGSFIETNIEKVLELEPDLVVAAGGADEDALARIEEAEIKVLRLDPQSIDEVLETIEVLGKVTDKTEEAETLIGEMEEKRDEILEKVASAEEVKVFYEVWHDPLQTADSNSFIGSLIELAGGKNIIDTVERDSEDEGNPYPQISEELLIEADPDIYLAADDGFKEIDEIKGRPGYEDLTAVKEDQIYFLDENIISRAGPRIVEALELIAETIHPELFE